MNYIESSLSKNEHIYKQFKLHPMAWWIFWLLIALAIPSFGITLMMAIAQLIYIKSTEMGVTNKRIIRKYGWISRQTQEMKLSSVETVTINQSVLGRIFDYGDVLVTGKGISDVIFKKVDSPMRVKIAIEDQDCFENKEAPQNSDASV